MWIYEYPKHQGRGYRIVKIYFAILICFTTNIKHVELVTMATHIELVGGLSSNSFVSALRRFLLRGIKLTDIYSNNGTSFVGSYNDNLTF